MKFFKANPLLVALLGLVTCLMLVEWLRAAPLGSALVISERDSIIDAVLSKSGQAWMIFCLVIWHLTLVWVNRHARASGSQAAFKSWVDLLKTALVVCSVIVYVFGWSTFPEPNGFDQLLLGIDQTSNVLVFLIGIVFSQLVELAIFRSTAEARSSFLQVSVFYVAVFFAATSWLQSEIPHEYKYRDHLRWTGLWVNPNTYGLLMAVALVLICSLMIAEACSLLSRKPERRNTAWLKIGAWAGPFLLVLIGLVQSFSRGAWLAAAAGLFYVLWQASRAPGFPQSRPILWVRRNWLSLAVGLCAIAAAVFWLSQYSESVVTRRAFSVSNPNDFSWQNRVAAWRGLLQMMGDKPWLGFGWGQVEPIYNAYYRAAELDDGMAVQLNDYLTLATSIGLLALAGFALLVAFRLFPNPGSNDSRPGPAKDIQLKNACRAGVIVLLIGFWFDGGLFKLALAAPFWLLLELSAPEKDGTAANISTLWRKYRTLVGFLVLAAGGAIFWGKRTDSFERISFNLNVPDSAPVRGTVVMSKPAGPRPVAVYLHGINGDITKDGRELRQLAELGLAAVSIEYDQTNSATFDSQFKAVLGYLRHQSRASSNATAWIGSSLGAQRTLSFVLNNPSLQPQLLVRLSGGWVPELDNVSNEQSSSPGQTGSNIISQISCKVLLVHGEADETFPLADAQKLALFLKRNGVQADLRILPKDSHDLEPDRNLAFRLVGEYCRSILAATSPSVPKSRAVPFWACEIPALAWLLALVGAYRKGIWRSLTPLDLTKNEKRLRWLALGLGCAAATLASLHWFVPQLAVSSHALELGRRFLVPASGRSNYDWQGSQSIWQGKKLKSLVDCVELADYTRLLVNWKLDDLMYRDFVLSSVINGTPAEEPGWRRTLWRSFYPRIRKEQTPSDAAIIVARYLREHVTITDKPIPQVGIESGWETGVADATGFEAMYVAALRSVGIAARLNQSGVAEYWTGQQWEAAPRPPVSSFI